MDPNLAYESVNSVPHECEIGGEIVLGCEDYYDCKEHDFKWFGRPAHPRQVNFGEWGTFDPDFAANMSSPA